MNDSRELWDPKRPDIQANPHPWLARLRREAPIHAHLEDDGAISWMLTRHRDCVAVLRDPAWSAAKFPPAILQAVAADPSAPFSVVARAALSMMLLKDGDDHARLRTLVNKAFTPRVVAELRPRVQGITDELLDAAERRGGFDAIEDLGLPLPVIVIAELLGVPLASRADLKRWSDALVMFLDGTIRQQGIVRAAAACNEMRAYFDSLFAQRRAHFCLGAALARLETEIAIGSTVARFPGLKFLDEAPQWKPGIVLRGLDELQLTL